MQLHAANPAFRLLHCPICRLDFAPAARSLICAHGHTFDLAREGYVNLTAGRHLPAESGDGRAQLQRRDAFLRGGYLDAVGDAIAHALDFPRVLGTYRIIDAGCGTGYHLRRLLDYVEVQDIRPCGLGLDLSKHAARFAARVPGNASFAVADLWRAWPIKSRAADLVLSIFAPKHLAEMARVLAPWGMLAMAYPGPDHLGELRRELGLIGLSADKGRRYDQAVRQSFSEVRRESLRWQASLSRDSVVDAILMGPNARHAKASALTNVPERASVTFDIEVLFARLPLPPQSL